MTTLKNALDDVHDQRSSHYGSVEEEKNSVICLLASPLTKTFFPPLT